MVYICKSGPTAMSFTNTKKLLAFIRWPKSTPTGQRVREWLASFEQKPQAPAPELDMTKIKVEGFGPEAYDPDALVNVLFDDDPTANTKMVT